MNAVETLRSLMDDDLKHLPEDKLIEIFQHIHGLKVDGRMGPVTEREIARPRFCAVEDKLRAKGTRARWDHTTWDGKKFSGPPTNMVLLYHVAGALPNLSKGQTDQAFAEALSYWTAVCAVAFVPTADPNSANLLFEIGKIDGPSSTLAWQELPEGKDTTKTTLRGLYDAGEPWVDSADPSNSNIDCVRVICHETGHGLGLDHGPEGNLLAPYYDRQIRKPQSWDISEAQLRYGPPVPASVPDTPPAPGQRRIKLDLIDEFGKRWNGEAVPVAI